MRRLLLIDDEQDFRELIARALRRRGWEVSEAGDGRSGLSAALAADFDVVICDVRMPGVDGFAFLEAIKDDRPAVRVILVSGATTTGIASRSAELGAFAFLAKPFSLEGLYSTVEAAAGGGTSRA